MDETAVLLLRPRKVIAHTQDLYEQGKMVMMGLVKCRRDVVKRLPDILYYEGVDISCLMRQGFGREILLLVTESVLFPYLFLIHRAAKYGGNLVPSTAAAAAEASSQCRPVI